MLLAAGVALALLLILVRSNYLLFHCVVELFSVAVACGIFMIVWNTRQFAPAGYILLLGVAYASAGAIDLLHTLAYKGMGVFPAGGEPNLATQLWVAGRLLESVSLVAAFLFVRRRLAEWAVVAVYSAVVVLILLLVFFWRVFPVCYDPETGLTAFKHTCELVVIGMLLVALALLVRSRAAFGRSVLLWLSASIVLTIASEVAFMLYGRDLFGTWNFLGHLLKLLSFYLVYKALIATGLRDPYELLFHNLEQSRNDLQRARDGLEARVRQRTAELADTVDSLQREVRERIEVEQRLRESEQRLRLIAENVQDVFWMSTPRLQEMLYVSPAYERIWGRSREGLYQRPESLWDAVHPEDRAEVGAALKENEDSGWDLEHRIVRPDGEVRWVRNRGYPVLDEEGRVVRMTGVVTDVTPRRQQQEEVDRERQRLFSVLNLLPGYVALVDADHAVRFANHRFLEAFGEPAGEPCYRVLMGRDKACEDCPLTRVLETEEAADWEWSAPGGQQYHTWGYPFSDMDGTPVVLMLGMDVTERKELERRVIEAGEAERRSIGRDLHDSLGQELTGLGLLAEAMGRSASAGSPGAVDMADQMISLAREAIAQVRAMSRGLDPVALGGGGLAGGLAELAAGVEQQSGIPCTFRCHEDVSIEDEQVATQLYRIAQEAVNNAVRHAKAGRIDISLTAHRSGVLLVVTDDGRGISGEGGNGMGMRTMRYRASVLGGTLDVRPRPDGGTTVTCSLTRRQHGGGGK